jgi:hypothetical protein
MEDISQPIFKEGKVAFSDGKHIFVGSQLATEEEVPTLSPPRRGWFTGLLGYNVFAMIFFFMAVYLLGCRIFGHANRISEDEIVFYFCAAFFVIVYYSFAAVGETNKYLSNIRSPAELMDHFTELKKKQPQLQVVSICFHWETNDTTCCCFTEKMITAEAIKRLRRNDPVSKLVITETNTTELKLTSVMDLSGVISEEMQKESFVKVEFMKDFNFSNADTVTTILDELKNSNERDRNKDLNYSLSLESTIEGCKDKILVIRPDDRRFYISRGFYILMTLLFMAAPYSIWLDRITKRADIKVKKLLTV